MRSRRWERELYGRYDGSNASGGDGKRLGNTLNSDCHKTAVMRQKPHVFSPISTVVPLGPAFS